MKKKKCTKSMLRDSRLIFYLFLVKILHKPALIFNKYIRSLYLIPHFERLIKQNKHKTLMILLSRNWQSGHIVFSLNNQELTQDKWNSWTHILNGWMNSSFLNSSKQIEQWDWENLVLYSWKCKIGGKALMTRL